MRFILHNPGKTASPVYFLVRKNRKGHQIFLKYPVGISLTKDEWNDSKQSVRELAGIPHRSHNKTIKTISETTEKLFNNNDFFSLTPEIIREQIDIALGRRKNKSNNFLDYFKRFHETMVNKTDGKTRHFITTHSKIKAFSPGIDWEDVDYSFYSRFVAKLEKKGLSKNYIGRQIKNIKIVMSAAEKEGIHDNQTYKLFKTPSEQVYNVYLSEKELERLYALKLNGHLEKARDLFLIGCYTGMRADNYLNIDPDIHIGEKFITAVVNKNGPRVKIPKHWIVREIIEKYDGLPKSISQQKLNVYIKDFCSMKKAKLDEKVITVKTVGGKRIEIVKRKHEMITTHTARRSLVTNLYLKGAPLKYIMSITGHTTEAQCLSYIKTGLDELADKVAEMDFWQK